MSVAPLIRRVIACQKITVDSSAPGMPYTLHGVLGSIKAPRFPFLFPELWLFVQYADGDGTHLPIAEVIRTELADETAVMRIPLPPIHMTKGRFYVLSRAYKLRRIPFRDAGLYEFRIRCGANSAADEIRMEL
jgi:hypothetical protein